MWNKCVKRNKKYISSKHILHEMNGAVLCNTSESIFYFYGKIIDEVLEYCKNNNYNVDKIVFLTSYDIDIDKNELDKHNVKMHADSKIQIVEEDNKLIAVVFMGDSICFNKV